MSIKELTPVTSSQIDAIGHDPETNTLAVRFRGGSTYHYADVTAEQYDEFYRSESLGKHFGANFKNNGSHPYTKVA